MTSRYYYDSNSFVEEPDSTGTKRKQSNLPIKTKRHKDGKQYEKREQYKNEEIGQMNDEEIGQMNDEKISTPPLQRLRLKSSIDDKNNGGKNLSGLTPSPYTPGRVLGIGQMNDEEEFTEKIICPEEQPNESIEFDPRFQYFYSKAEEFTKHFLDTTYIEFDSNYYSYFINIKDNIFQILKKEQKYYNNEFYLALFFTVFNNVTNKVIKMNTKKKIIIDFKEIMMEFLINTKTMKDPEIKNFYQIENYYNVINLTFKRYRNDQVMNRELLSLFDKKDCFHLSRDCVKINKANIFDILNTVKSEDNDYKNTVKSEDNYYNKEKLIECCIKRLAFEPRNKKNDFLTSTFEHYSRIVELFMEYFDKADDKITQEEIDSYFD